MKIMTSWKQLHVRYKLLSPAKRRQIDWSVTLWVSHFTLFLWGIVFLVIVLIYSIHYILYFEFHIRIPVSSLQNFMVTFFPKASVIVYLYFIITRIPRNKKIMKKLEELEKSNK